MKNLKTYYVPVKCTLTTTLAIDAVNQMDATEQVSKIMAKNEGALNDRYDTALIMYADITCKEDDEMIDEMAKDLNLKPELNNNQELYTHTIDKECKTQAVNNITIYTGTDCPWCHKTIKYLSSKKLLFVDKNVNTHPQFKDEMISLTRQSSLPALIINGKIVLGFDKRAIEAALNA